MLVLIAVVDLDRFGAYNDAHGELTGDEGVVSSELRVGLYSQLSWRG